MTTTSSADTKKIELHTSDGEALVRICTIGCPGELPQLVQWDDPENGERLFLLQGENSYREVPVYLLSIGEVPTRARRD